MGKDWRGKGKREGKRKSMERKGVQEGGEIRDGCQGEGKEEEKEREV